MKKFIDVSIVVVSLLCLGAFFFFPYYGMYLATKDSKFFWTAYQFEKTRGEYFFDGANKRGLLDICKKDGKFQVLFKEDCEVKEVKDDKK